MSPAYCRKSPFLLLLLALAVLNACSSSSSAPSRETHTSAKSTNDRKPAPAFALTDANGSKVRLADYRGKVVLLNFWATWCGPCELEIPWFQEFEQQYKSKGFEVVGVSMDEDGWPVIKPYIAEHKVNYRILLGDDSVSQLYGGVEALPTTFIIDRDGRFAFPPHVGLAAKSEYAREIQSLLDEKETNASGSFKSSPAAFLFGPAK
ncbi:MAG: TlpA family protein disulfide reductase [Acidobacteriota bacterium]|nr:TlpA family protein disulfide reductase [Acidobacteriota bacterium]